MRPGVRDQQLQAQRQLTSILRLKALIRRCAVIRGHGELRSDAVAQTADFAAQQAVADGSDVTQRERAVRAQRLIQGQVPFAEPRQQQAGREGITEQG
jgi:hypothetical protein